MNRSDANEKGEVFLFECIQPLTTLLVGERQRISCNLSALLSTKKGTTYCKMKVITKKQLNTMYMLQRSRVDNVFMP